MTRIFAFLYLILVLASPAMACEKHLFKGAHCTKDCSGHKAGYAWAKEKGIDSESGCTGKSQSFVKGCKIRVNENQPSDDHVSDKKSAIPAPGE